MVMVVYESDERRRWWRRLGFRGGEVERERLREREREREREIEIRSREKMKLGEKRQFISGP